MSPSWRRNPRTGEMELAQPRKWKPGPNAGWEPYDGEDEAADQPAPTLRQRGAWREHPALWVIAVAIPAAVAATVVLKLAGLARS